MQFPVNHNTNTEEETKVNTPCMLRYAIHFSFKDDILGERLYSATEGSLIRLGRNQQRCFNR